MKMRTVLLGCLVLLWSLATAYATDVRLAWDPPNAGTPTGYKLYQGTAPGVYDAPKDVGLVTSTTVADLPPGQTVYFAVTAYNQTGESGFSNEVSFTPPQPIPGAPRLRITITVEQLPDAFVPKERVKKK
jgi:hypothetical protein